MYACARIGVVCSSSPARKNKALRKSTNAPKNLNKKIDKYARLFYDNHGEEIRAFFADETNRKLVDALQAMVMDTPEEEKRRGLEIYTEILVPGLEKNEAELVESLQRSIWHSKVIQALWETPETKDVERVLRSMNVHEWEEHRPLITALQKMMDAAPEDKDDANRNLREELDRSVKKTDKLTNAELHEEIGHMLNKWVSDM